MKKWFKKVGGGGVGSAKIAHIPHKNGQYSCKKQQLYAQNQQKDIKFDFEKNIRKT